MWAAIEELLSPLLLLKRGWGLQLSCVCVVCYLVLARSLAADWEAVCQVAPPSQRHRERIAHLVRCSISCLMSCRRCPAICDAAMVRGWKDTEQALYTGETRLLAPCCDREFRLGQRHVPALSRLFLSELQSLSCNSTLLYSTRLTMHLLACLCST